MAEVIIFSILCFMLGASTGSFLGLCAYRIPMGVYEPTREGIPQTAGPLSITTPVRSFCPVCKHQLSWLHIVPLFSWLLLRGKCGFCKTNIPLRYFIIELITATLCALCYLRFGLSLTALCAFIVISALILITYIDLDYMIIPDIVTYPGVALGLLIGAASSYFPLNGLLPLDKPFVQSLYESALGIICGAGFPYLVWWFYIIVRKREGLGLGDIKLLAALGAIFGYECALITIFIASVIGSLVGLGMVLRRKMGFASYLSFGPYLVIAALVYIFDFGNLILFVRGYAPTTSWRMFH